MCLGVLLWFALVCVFLELVGWRGVGGYSTVSLNFWGKFDEQLIWNGLLGSLPVEIN